MIKLGDKVKDKISGFEGVVDSIVEWLNGCRRMGVFATTLKDGVPLERQHFDEEQLELMQPGVIKRFVGAVQPGGDRPAPSRNADPKR